VRLIGFFSVSDLNPVAIHHDLGVAFAEDGHADDLRTRLACKTAHVVTGRFRCIDYFLP